MGDDWQVGDLALIYNVEPIECSCGCTIFTGRGCPPKGSVREVAEVCLNEAAGEDHWCDEYLIYLLFTDMSEALAVRCRKIRPHTPDAEDAETIALLTGKPAQVPA